MTPEQVDVVEKLTETALKKDVSIPLSARIRPNSEAAPWVIEEVRQLEAEVERLRSVLRQVHALADRGVSDWPAHTAFYALTEIHTITKGMVE